jgi:MFS transporter, DHA3 family, macrolide efflux protein
VNGLVFPCIHIGISTLILRWSHESIVGRVNGVLNPMFVGMMVIAMSVAGALKKNFELTAIFTGVGLLFLIGTLVLLPKMRLKAPAALQEA